MSLVGAAPRNGVSARASRAIITLSAIFPHGLGLIVFGMSAPSTLWFGGTLRTGRDSRCEWLHTASELLPGRPKGRRRRQDPELKDLHSILILYQFLFFTSVASRPKGRLPDKPRRHLLERRPRPVRRGLGGAADVDKAGDALVGLEPELVEHAAVVGVPLGHPVGRKAERVRGVHDVHGGSAGRQDLLPGRNLHMLARPAHDARSEERRVGKGRK